MKFSYAIRVAKSLRSGSEGGCIADNLQIARQCPRIYHAYTGNVLFIMSATPY